jgi:2-polyprenyl-6-methoxyphenol hydroxylase-like FAD-dependent oxidoreductase
MIRRRRGPSVAAMNTNRTALVAGATISGLAAGLALARAGREPVLLETSAGFEPLRGELTLDAAALAALDGLALAGVRRTLQRSELQILLLDALGEHRIRYGYEICCTGQDDLARVHLVSGGYVAAPILVDAQGSESPVRASLGIHRDPLRRRADGLIALVADDALGIQDAAALGRAVAAQPHFLGEALATYARTQRPVSPEAPSRRRRRLALTPAFGH